MEGPKQVVKPAWRLQKSSRVLAAAARSMFVAASEFADQSADDTLGITKNHQSLIEIVKFVFDTRETRTHPALDHHHGASLIHFEDRHAVDWAILVVSRGWIGDVVGADHQSDVDLWKLRIGVVHFD